MRALIADGRPARPGVDRRHDADGDGTTRGHAPIPGDGVGADRSHSCSRTRGSADERQGRRQNIGKLVAWIIQQGEREAVAWSDGKGDRAAFLEISVHGFRRKLRYSDAGGGRAAVGTFIGAYLAGRGV